MLCSIAPRSLLASCFAKDAYLVYVTCHPSRLTADVEELAAALRLEKVVLAATGGSAPYALGIASYVPERVQGMLLISPLLSAGASQGAAGCRSLVMRNRSSAGKMSMLNGQRKATYASLAHCCLPSCGPSVIACAISSTK